MMILNELAFDGYEEMFVDVGYRKGNSLQRKASC